MSVHERDLAHDAVDHVETYGYAVLPNAYSPALRSSLRDAAVRLLASDTTTGRDRGADGKDGFRGALHLDDTFLPLVDNPVVTRCMTDLLSPNIHLLSAHLIALPSADNAAARTIRTPARAGWHRDMFGVTNDLGWAHTPRLAIKAAYYLTDVTADCGLTMLLPGSHQHRQPARIPTGQIDPEGAITPEFGDNDVLLFENRTMHAGGLNTSGSPRLALMLQFGYRWLAPVDDTTADLWRRPGLTDVQRQLLGAPDRNADGSLAKGRGALPLRNRTRHPADGNRP